MGRDVKMNKRISKQTTTINRQAKRSDSLLLPLIWATACVAVIAGIPGSVFFLPRLEKLGLWGLGLLAADEGIANTFTWVSTN